MAKLIDLTGKKFGKLTVIKRSFPNNKYNNSRWLCRCDCGKEKITFRSYLIQGHTKSCGCLRSGRGRLPKGIASLRERFRQYKQAAKMRGYIFDLTEKQFAKLTQQNCHYCGAKPNNKQKTRTNYHEVYIYNGLDRVDNTKGYTIDNVVSCCKICNNKKGAMTLREFKNWIEKVYKKFEEGNKFV